MNVRWNVPKQVDGKERRRAFEEYEAACKLATARINGRARAYTAPEQVKTRTLVKLVSPMTVVIPHAVVVHSLGIFDHLLPQSKQDPHSCFANRGMKYCIKTSA